MNPVIPENPNLARFNQLVKQNELNPQVANQLYQVLSMCEVVLLCDDSDSMSKPIAEEGTDAFAPKRSTRWLELKKLASIVIDFVTSINPAGLDIYFLNRPCLTNVTSTAGLQGVFSMPPNGGTPLIGALNRIYKDKENVPLNRNLLIVVITDGEPNDTANPRADLYNTLVNKRSNVHISFAECTDNAEDMEYLDAFDCAIRNFDNTDDYREELNRVKMVQGQQFKFDFTDYVIKILLATFVRWYFQLDQVKVAQNYLQPTPVQQFQPPKQAYQANTQVQVQMTQPVPMPQSQVQVTPSQVQMTQQVQQVQPVPQVVSQTTQTTYTQNVPNSSSYSNQPTRHKSKCNLF
jgi:hypothetical protein